MLNRLFGSSAVQVIKVKEFKTQMNESGIVFYVKNGQGILTVKYGYLENEALSALLFGDIPLVKFHSNEPYFCPTCESLVSTGYGLDACNSELITEMHERFNHKYISVDDSFQSLTPLLGLLSSGYYALLDTELVPTNGNGEFFWKFNSIPTLNRASRSIHDGFGHWSSSKPYYILPTQPPNYYNEKQVEFYRGSNEYRALAYHLDGSLCALLDGHHKATAAALDSKKVKALVIMSTGSVWETNKQHNTQGGISINGITLTEDEMIVPVKTVLSQFKDKQMTKSETENYISKINSSYDSYIWPKEILDTEKCFPDALAAARIEWAGDLSDERLDRIISKAENVDENNAINIATALYHTKSPRFKEIVFHFCRDYSFVLQWPDLYRLLSNIGDSDVEDFFIDYLVQGDKDHPIVKNIVDDYLAG